VIDVDDRKASVMLDVTQQEIKIFTNFLKLKSETDTNLVAALNVKQNGIKGAYTANDLVNFNGGKNLGLVLQVHEDYLKIIDQQGKLVNVKTTDIGKKIPVLKPGSTISARDSKGNNLAIDQMVRVIEGPHKGTIAPIRHYDRNYIFLWHKQFV
jgi:transcription elongation factor